MSKTFLIGREESNLKYKVGVIEVDGIKVIEVTTLLRNGTVSRSYIPYRREFVEKFCEALMGVFDE